MALFSCSASYSAGVIIIASTSFLKFALNLLDRSFTRFCITNQNTNQFSTGVSNNCYSTDGISSGDVDSSEDTKNSSFSCQLTKILSRLHKPRMNGPVWHWPLSDNWYFFANVIIIKYTSHHRLSVLQPRNFSRCQFCEQITTTLSPTYALAFGPHYDPDCSLF